MSRLQALLTGAAATLAAIAVVEKRPPGGRGRYQRSNYAEREVSLLGGPATAAGLALAGLRAGRPGRAAATAVIAAGTAGALDDLTEDEAHRHIKGLGGHLRELRRGRVTTGVVKIVVIGLGAVAAAAQLTSRHHRSRPRYLAELLLNTTLIAGSANLINLLDLRPGRALKASGMVAGIVSVTSKARAAELAAATCGVVAAAWPDDLAERTMLGDTGANALGAAVGTALVAGCRLPARSVAAAGVIALTLLSERVSFSQLIDDIPALHALDSWGRR